MLRTFFGNLARKIGIGYVTNLPSNSRANVLEAVSESLIEEVPIPGGSLKFLAHSPLLLMRARTLLTKERDTIEWIGTIGAGEVLWDIGANVGVYSLYAAAHSKCKVLSFEPSAANYLALTRNIEVNGLNDRATAYCLAFAQQSQLGVLNLASPAMGTAMSQFGEKGETSRYWSGAQGAAHGMIGFSIDDFVARFGPSFPTHMKIDVDGLEWPILQGAAKTLADGRLKSLIVELSLTHLAEREHSIALLAACGLRLTSQGEIQGVGNETASNHLFTRVQS